MEKSNSNIKPGMALICLILILTAGCGQEKQKKDHAKDVLDQKCIQEFMNIGSTPEESLVNGLRAYDQCKKK